jgi:hypothetical protein
MTAEEVLGADSQNARVTMKQNGPAGIRGAAVSHDGIGY